MAYLDQNEDEEEKPQQTQEQGGTSPQTASGGISTPTSSVGQAQVQSGAKGKAPAFQDLGAYIRANQPQTQQMGQKVAGNLTNQFNTTKGAIDTANQGFNQQVQQNTVNLDQDLLNQAASDPTGIAQDQAKKGQFKNMLNAQYQGPQSFETQDFYQGLNDQVSRASQAANTASNPAFLQNAVAMQAKNPTAGTKALDSLLIQQTPDAYNAVRQASKPLGTLGDYLSQARNTGNTAASQAAQTTAQTAQQTRDKFLGNNGVVSQFEKGLQDKLLAANQQRDAFNAAQTAIQNKLYNGQDLTPEEYAQLGGTPGAFPQANDLQNYFTKYYGNNYYKPIGGTPQDMPLLNNFFQPGELSTNAPDLESVASSEDYAKDAALEDLLGQSLGVKNTPEKAGTYQMGGKAATGKLNDYLASAKNAATYNDISRLFALTGANNSAESSALKNLVGSFGGQDARIAQWLKDNPQGLNWSPEEQKIIDDIYNRHYGK